MPIFLKRKSRETDIQIELEAWGTGVLVGKTGQGFFDHMLHTLIFYSRLDMKFQHQGDWDVDQHHSLEDLGLLMGKSLKAALESASFPITRFSSCYMPMDESLVRVVLDLGGRPYLTYRMPPLAERVGSFETECLKEFLRAFSQGAQLTLHIEALYGENSHHLIEALFKGLGLCLRHALKEESTLLQPNSVKGLID